jgi:hypothetical protein
MMTRENEDNWRRKKENKKRVMKTHILQQKIGVRWNEEKYTNTSNKK